MKKVFAIILCLCLCLTLLPAFALTASAGVGFSVTVGNTSCGSGTTVLPDGHGTVTVDCTGSNVTITLDSCTIGTSVVCHDGANVYNCGLLFMGDQNEPADVTLVLKGYNEIIPSVLILNAASLTVTSIDDGNLTVHTNFTTHCPVLLDKTDLTVTGTQSMLDAAFMCDELTVDRPAVKGGGTLDQTMLTIETSRYFGLSCSNLTINSGIINISAQNLGLLMISGSEDAPQLQVNGGVSSFSGGVAAVYICGHYGDMSNIKLGDKIGDYNGNVLASTEYDKGFCKQSWIAPDEEYPLYFCDADGNNDFWYDYDLMSNAAKLISLKEIMNVYVTLDAGEFGQVQNAIYLIPYGEPLGVLPEPINTTFHEGEFNNMYFNGWWSDEECDYIEENYVPTHNITLRAMWMEGQGTSNFTDVPSNAWYKDAVDYCATKDLVAGTTATTFSPSVICSRAMVVSLLYRLSGEPSVYLGDNPFSDVPNNSWYADAVVWAAEKGIVAGDGKGKFNPNANITREQLACIMMEYADFCALRDPDAGIMLAGFPDSGKVSSWAGDGVSWAVGTGLISGKPKDGKNYLDPLATATRAEVVSILLSYMQLTDCPTTFYYQDFTVTVPDLWQGDVCAERDENGISFYDKRLHALDGQGRLFILCFTENFVYSEWINPEYFCVMINNGDHNFLSEVFFEMPTDVQCVYPAATGIGARYFTMQNMRDWLVITHPFAFQSFGVG